MLPPPPRYKQRIQDHDARAQEADKRRRDKKRAKLVQKLKEDAWRREQAMAAQAARASQQNQTINVSSQVRITYTNQAINGTSTISWDL